METKGYRPDILIVSNRLPVRLEKQEGKWVAEPASGGLVTALSGVRDEINFRWIGWPGVAVPEEEQDEVRMLLRETLNFEPVFLTDQEISHFYDGFSNSVLWPLFHYLPGRVDFDLPYWDVYKTVNEKFADTIAKSAGKNDLVWVHDYHLFLVPQLLRDRKPTLRTGFFLHIPFPTSELFRLLPVRKEILAGVLGADLIGFHTHDYSRHFSRSCARLLGAEPGPTEIEWNERKVAIGTYPIGINAKSFIETLQKDDTAKKRKFLTEQYAGKKLILGIDRGDYSKGLPHKLRAYERFLEQHPEWKNKVVLLQVAIPSRMDVKEYQTLKSEVDELVGRINGKFNTPSWSPIQYMAQEIPFHEMCALYERADVMMVTPVRDGMNLVAMEYSACQRERHGTLILSEFAGVARMLGGSLFVNPFDADATADTLAQALTMDKPQRAQRALQNYRYVRDFNSLGWAKRYLRDLGTGSIGSGNPPEDLQSEFFSLKREFSRAYKRLVLLDYDGTLVPFSAKPGEAAPPDKVINLLTQLSKNEKNEVYLISGRSSDDLQNWFGDLPIGLSAEHGLYVRHPGQKEWTQRQEIQTDWMDEIERTIRDYVRQTPGSHFERKNASVAWHYREADEQFGEWQALELITHLDDILTNLPVSVLQGHKVVEIRPQGIDKGALAREIFEKSEADGLSVICVGDDRTDEDMFAVLPHWAWTCRVGKHVSTNARFFLENPEEVLETLEDISLIP